MNWKQNKTYPDMLSPLLLTLFHRHLIKSGISESRIVEIAPDDRANKPLRDPDVLLSSLRERVPGDGVSTYVVLDIVSRFRGRSDEIRV